MSSGGEPVIIKKGRKTFDFVKGRADMKFQTKGFESILADKDAEQNGVWFDLEELTGLHFKCRRMGGSNHAYQRRLSTAIKPYSYQIQSNSLDTEKMNEIYVRVFCDACLVDWHGPLDENGNPTRKGPLDEDGNVVEYTPEVGYEYFMQFGDVFKILEKLAGDLNSYSQATVEAAKKS